MCDVIALGVKRWDTKRPVTTSESGSKKAKMRVNDVHTQSIGYMIEKKAKCDEAPSLKYEIVSNIAKSYNREGLSEQAEGDSSAASPHRDPMVYQKAFVAGMQPYECGTSKTNGMVAAMRARFLQEQKNLATTL